MVKCLFNGKVNELYGVNGDETYEKIIYKNGFTRNILWAPTQQFIDCFCSKSCIIVARGNKHFDQPFEPDCLFDIESDSNKYKCSNGCNDC